MNARAILFDVYGTLFRVGPAPADADARWNRLFQDFFQMPPSVSRLNFSIACSQVIAKEHSIARLRGIAFPEVEWPSVVAAVLPEFSRLAAARRTEFIFHQMQIGRTVEMSAAAAELLGGLRAKGCLLGIVSNAQAYTLAELTEQLGRFGLNFDIFERDLCLWSFQNGFSKPDSHVFQMLAARLEARGISAAQSLVVGDRLDNDIEPALKHGFQAWEFSEQPRGGLKDGNWAQLREWLLAIR